MSVGLPGSGIGGLFYLLSALWMPFDGALRTARKPRIAPVLLALGIVAALFVTGWAIAVVIASNATVATYATGMSRNGHATVPTMFRTATFVLSFGTLACVLLSVQVMRLLFARKRDVVEQIKEEDRKAA